MIFDYEVDFWNKGFQLIREAIDRDIMKKYKPILKESAYKIGQKGEVGIIFDIMGNTAYEFAPKEVESKLLQWDRAKIYCGGKIYGDKYDWVLPSKDQLNKIYNTNKRKFANEYYWSSSEANAFGIWVVNLHTGEVSSSLNTSKHKVLPIREFEI